MFLDHDIRLINPVLQIRNYSDRIRCIPKLWHTPAIPALSELMQEDCDFKSNPDHMGKVYFKNKNETKI